MRTGWVGLLAVAASAWMCGCAAGAPEQVEGSDPSMLGGMSGGGGTGGAGGSAGKGGSGGSGGRSGSGGNAGTTAPPSGSGGSSADGGMTMDGGGDSGPGSDGECEDGDKNGVETGTDCGGPDCEPCPDGTGCVIDSDCESEYCGSGFTCATPGCDDDTKNGDETDVDCGAECPGCANNRDCAEDDDCMSGACEDDKCVCQPLDECGAEECGQKPDGCGGMVDCSHACGSTEMCQANACVEIPMCNPDDCNNGCLGTRCCKSDNTCGCRLLGFLTCN